MSTFPMATLALKNPQKMDARRVERKSRLIPHPVSNGPLNLDQESQAWAAAA